MAVFAKVMGEILDRDNDLIAVEDHSVIALGTYARLYREWVPGSINAPALLLRASDPIGDAFEGGRLPAWQLPPDIVEVPGHHFELIEDGAEATANAIETWLAEKVAPARVAQRG